MDWSVVPISALVSAVVALAIRWLDKPRPHLVATGRMVVVPSGAGEAMRQSLGAPVTLTNHGSGPAYDLEVAGSGCVVGIRQPKIHDFGGESWDDRIPVLAAGETVVLDVQGWEQSSQDVIITVSHPRLQVMRWWRRTWMWPLSEVPTENPFPPAIYPPERIPWIKRRTGSIARYGLRARVARLEDEEDQPQDGD